MNTSSSFKTSVFSPSNVPSSLLRQYGMLRYQCFTQDDPYVNLDHVQKTEFDHFDRDEHTQYIMIYMEDAQKQQDLVSAVRIRPTLADYELEMPSYLYLTRNTNLPKDATVYEGSRWVGKSSRTAEGMLSTAMLVSKLYYLSRELSFNELIGTISTLSESWLSKRSAQTERRTSTYHSNRDKLDIMVSRIRMDETFLGVANTLLQQALMELTFEEVMITRPATKKAA